MYTLCVPVLQMSHAMQVKPADSEGKAGVSPAVHVWYCVHALLCLSNCITCNGFSAVLMPVALVVLSQ